MERRDHRRIAIQVDSSFNAEARLDGQVKRFELSILDIGEGGMKIATSFVFPAGTPVPLQVEWDEPLEVTVLLVWQKPLESGFLMGVMFVGLTEASRDRVKRFMGRFTRVEMRHAFRLQRVLSVEMDLGPSRGKLNAVTRDLSVSGIGVTTGQLLPVDGPIPCRIQLEYSLPPVAVLGRVAWQRNGVVGIQFQDPPPAVVDRIARFVDKAITLAWDEGDL